MASSYRNIHPVKEIVKQLMFAAIPPESQLIHEKVMYKIEGAQSSGTFLKENTRNYMGVASGLDAQRASGSAFARISTFDRTSIEYQVENFGLSHEIPYEDIRDSQYGAEETRAAEIVKRAMDLAREDRCASVLFNASNFQTDTAGNIFGGFVDAAGTKAYDGLRTLRDTVFKNANTDPDTLILGHDVFQAFCKNPDIRGYLGTSTAGIASGGRSLSEEACLQILRQELNIPFVYVASARKDSAIPGGSSSNAFIWDSETIFCGRLQGTNELKQNSGNIKGAAVAALNFENESLTADAEDEWSRNVCVVRAMERHVYKVIDSNTGFVVTNCLA